MKQFIKKHKTEIFFWGITALLAASVLFGLSYSLGFLGTKVAKLTDKNLIKASEVVKFNLEELEELLEAKKLQ